MSKRILITSRSFGTVSDMPGKILEEAGLEVTSLTDNFDQKKFEKIVTQFDMLIIGGHKLPEEVMKKCFRLKLICKHGAGLDNIPLDIAGEMGIKVCNAPGTNANAVADLTIGLMLSLCRGICRADRMVRGGQWKTIIGNDLFAKNLGLLGFGTIARSVARRARGFSMNIAAYDPYITQIPDEFKEYVTLAAKDTVIAQSDVLSLHMPLNQETRGMISSEAIGRMKQGAYLINTSRGGIVDEQALYEALSSEKLAGAALDVLEKEPLRKESPLARLDQVIITPHIGMYSKEAIEAVSIICAENAAAMLAGRELKFCVR